MLWDIFCRVIDNFGDIGVCWRLSADLAQRGEQVRLWVDDSSALEWMSPGAVQGQCKGIQVLAWQQSSSPDCLQDITLADVWVEAFGCYIEPAFIAHFAAKIERAQSANKAPAWINLEYLSAEPYVERAHGLPSPVMCGPAKGWTKHFFYPGFSTRTGGLLREPDLAQRQQINAQSMPPTAFGAATGPGASGDTCDPCKPERQISLFCYEPAGLPALLNALINDPAFCNRLWVTPGRAASAVRARMGQTLQQGSLHIDYLPPLTQGGYDALLWRCDLNFVRGEDSLVRALWAGKPCVWQIYPQEDCAHIAKLQAFLDRIAAPPALRELHDQWNGIATGVAQAGSAAFLALPDMADWLQTARGVKARLWELPDLTGSLLQFVHKNR